MLCTVYTEDKYKRDKTAKTDNCQSKKGMSSENPSKSKKGANGQKTAVDSRANGVLEFLLNTEWKEKKRGIEREGSTFWSSNTIQ